MKKNGNFPVVQWLRLYAFTAEGPVQSLVREPWSSNLGGMAKKPPKPLEKWSKAQRPEGRKMIRGSETWGEISRCTALVYVES